MTTLAADARRNFELGDTAEYGVVATDIIYQGAAVGDNASGYARPLVAGDPFLGFAEAQAVNTGAAADVSVRVRRSGRVQLAVGSAAATDVGKDVYASDDDTFTMTQSTNTRIGTIVRYISSGVAVVEFSGVGSRVTELTDSSGGTASDTLAAISGAYVQAEIRNSIASLSAKVNYLLRRLGA